MIAQVASTVARGLGQFGGATAAGRFVGAVVAAVTGRSYIERLSGLSDDLTIALVAVDWTSGNAVVNGAASALLDLPVGTHPTAEFTAALKNLAARALNHHEADALIATIDGQSRATVSSTWVFPETRTYLGVVSKPATYPGFAGRIWAFNDNSLLAHTVEADVQAAWLVRATADAMLDPQVILEAVWRDGRVVDLIHRDINAAGCAFFGTSRDRFVGQSMIDKGLMDVYARVAATGEPVILDAYPYEAEFAGEQRYYDIRATRVRAGLIVVTWRDVTERIDAAARIAASEQQFRLLAENVGDVVLRLTDEGVVTWVSESVEQALGAPPVYWTNRHFADFSVPGRRADARQRWADVVAGQSFMGRRQVRGPDGAPHWIHLRSEPFYDGAGRRDGIVASFRVIDDEVAVEDAARDEIASRDTHNRKLAKYLKAQTNRLMADLRSAARYVASILPEDLSGRVSVKSLYKPAEELGGDTYDFRWLDDDHLMVYLVDVSGHGVGPALMSVSVHNLLRSGTFGLETLLQPDAVLAQLNRQFQMDRHGGNYFTIWYGVFEASTRTLRYSNAGHPPALAMDGAASGPEQLCACSVPVGILEDTTFATCTYVVPPDTEILLYSDGALELGLPDGLQRPLDEFSALYNESFRKSDATLNALVANLEEDGASATVTDDSTFVLVSIP